MKAFTKLMAGILMVLFVFSFVAIAKAAVLPPRCVITATQWSGPQAVVGQAIDLVFTVNSPQTCAGKVVVLTIYEDDWTPFANDLLQTINNTFQGANATRRVSHTFTQQNFIDGGSEARGHVFFNATANEQTLSINSNNVPFYQNQQGGAIVGACADSNGNYLCSPSGKTDCSDATGCAGKTCYQIAPTFCGTKVPPPGQPVNVVYDIPNPFGNNNNIIALINLIATWIFNAAIPVVVILIIWAGIKFITSRGNISQIQGAKTILWYALIGLAIVLIGRGFVELIVTFLQS